VAGQQENLVYPEEAFFSLVTLIRLLSR